MAQVTSDHIWYPAGYPGPAYDLRQIVSWSVPQEDPDAVDVHFAGDCVFAVRFPDRAAFLTAKDASLTGGG